MSAGRYEIWECTNSECQLRFPLIERDARRLACPKCAGPVRLVLDALITSSGALKFSQTPYLPTISVFLDNIRSTFNVGSILRTADGCGVEHLYLCGITATPAHPKVAKTALGAERTVAWSYHANGLRAAQELVQQGRTLWALEPGPKAVSLFSSDLVTGSTASNPILVVGNEVTGVDPAIVDLCERSIVIPMFGAKRSLNVAIALSVAAYWLCGQRLNLQ